MILNGCRRFLTTAGVMLYFTVAGCGPAASIDERDTGVDVAERNDAPSSRFRDTGQADRRPILSPQTHRFDELPASDSSIVVAIDADMTSASARSGESIRRGVALAVDEINRGGGVLGRMLELIVRDHRGNPARGIDNIEELAQIPNLVAVIGGIHTPVAMEELETIHQRKVIYLSPWAAGTALVDNGFTTNYVFRVSVRDEYAGEFLINAAVEDDCHRIALLLERTAWGRSNETAMTQALRSRGMRSVSTQWFNLGEPSLQQQIQAIADADAQAVVLVANPLEGRRAIDAIESLPAGSWPMVFSHWGITGGEFNVVTNPGVPGVDLRCLQTFSFLGDNLSPKATTLIAGYCRQFDDAKTARDIFAPAGTAHAYDLVHLLALAIEEAGSLDRERVRDSLEAIELYSGLLRDYAPPFSEDDHDALTMDDFQLARFDRDGVIVPVDKVDDGGDDE